MIRKINQEMLDWFLDTAENGNREFDVGKYHLIFWYAVVKYGIWYKEEEEVTDIKKCRDNVTTDEKYFKFYVNKVVYNVTNIDEEFVTHITLDRLNENMYLIPETAEENVNLFFKALTDYIQMNKGVHYEK